MQVKKDIMWRINGSFILICIIALVILGQIIKIQFYEGEMWRQRADSLTLQYKNIEATRGNIFSADGKLISTSIPIYDIRMDTRADGLTDKVFYDGLDSLALSLSNLFKDRTPAEYRRLISKARTSRKEGRYLLIRRNITYTELQTLKTFPLFRLGRYKGGLRVEQKEMRERPFKMLAARTIGSMRDVKPVGIEASFNDELKGVGGKRLMQKISGNIWMPVSDKDVIEPKDGNDIITTLDVNIQDVAENSLKHHLSRHNADHGCAVVMEVATGEIKAIANLTRMKNGEYSEDFNYVIGEATEPGSTMKLASVLAALDDGYIEPDDSVVVGNGTYNYFGLRMKDAHPPKKSKLSVQQAFETSSNVGISRIIYANYAKKPASFSAKLKSFGLSEPLGLEIEGEGRPLIKDPSAKSWSSVSLPWISIGYESHLTPLQMLTFYNGVANDGRVVKPRLVKEIRKHGKLIKEFPVVVLRDSIASPDAIAKAKQMMEGVVENGSASSLKSSHYKIAGKTGTAQIAKNKYGYDKDHPSYQASFAGYFPADAPKYSCIVVVYSPSGEGFYGGIVAAPVFKDIADKVYATRIELHDKDDDEDSLITIAPFAKAGQQKELIKIFSELGIPSVSNDEEAMNVSAVAADERFVLKERKSSVGIVPDVIGMSVKDALYTLENCGMRVLCTGKGKVIKQSIQPGSRILAEQVIAIDLGL